MPSRPATRASSPNSPPRASARPSCPQPAADARPEHLHTLAITDRPPALEPSQP